MEPHAVRGHDTNIQDTQLQSFHSVYRNAATSGERSVGAGVLVGVRTSVLLQGLTTGAAACVSKLVEAGPLVVGILTWTSSNTGVLHG